MSSAIRRIHLPTRTVTTVYKHEGLGVLATYLDKKLRPGDPRFVALDRSENFLYVTCGRGFLLRIDLRPNQAMQRLKQADVLTSDWLNAGCWALVAEFSIQCTLRRHHSSLVLFWFALVSRMWWSGGGGVTSDDCEMVKLSDGVEPAGLAVTPNGSPLVSCVESHCLYLLDSFDGQPQLLAGMP